MRKRKFNNYPHSRRQVALRLTDEDHLNLARAAELMDTNRSDAVGRLVREWLLERSIER